MNILHSTMISNSELADVLVISRKLDLHTLINLAQVSKEMKALLNNDFVKNSVLSEDTTIPVVSFAKKFDKANTFSELKKFYIDMSEKGNIDVIRFIMDIQNKDMILDSNSYDFIFTRCFDFIHENNIIEINDLISLYNLLLEKLYWNIGMRDIMNTKNMRCLYYARIMNIISEFYRYIIVNRDVFKTCICTINNVNDTITNIISDLITVIRNKNIEFLLNERNNITDIGVRTEFVRTLKHNIKLSNAWKESYIENKDVFIGVRGGVFVKVSNGKKKYL